MELYPFKGRPEQLRPATWDLGPAANVKLDAGAIINNMVGATFATVGANSYSGENSIYAGDSSAVAFNNAGTFASSATVGIGVSVPFVNTGSLLVQQGYLNVPTFTSWGAVTVSARTHSERERLPFNPQSSCPVGTFSRRHRARRSPPA